MRLILLLSALLSAIAGYTPAAAAARPVEMGQVVRIARPAAVETTARPANEAAPAKLCALADAAPPLGAQHPLYADRLLI